MKRKQILKMIDKLGKKELADRIGVGWQTVHYWSKDDGPMPQGLNLQKLKALERELRIDEFMVWKSYPQNKPAISEEKILVRFVNKDGYVDFDVDQYFGHFRLHGENVTDWMRIDY